MRKLRKSLTADAAEALYTTMILPMFTYCGTLSLIIPDSELKNIIGVENREKNVITPKNRKNIELRIPSASSLIKKRTCTTVFDRLSNNI